MELELLKKIVRSASEREMDFTRGAESGVESF
jgi:hypothetical protein